MREEARADKGLPVLRRLRVCSPITRSAALVDVDALRPNLADPVLRTQPVSPHQVLRPHPPELPGDDFRRSNSDHPFSASLANHAQLSSAEAAQTDSWRAAPSHAGAGQAEQASQEAARRIEP